MGVLYGTIFLVFVMNFDKNIHRYCEKLGFQLETSRIQKFYMLFTCIGLFVALGIYYSGQKESWIMPLDWIKNSTDKEIECRDDLFRHS